MEDQTELTISRRSFLKGLGLTGSGLLAVACQPAPQVPSREEVLEHHTRIIQATRTSPDYSLPAEIARLSSECVASTLYVSASGGPGAGTLLSTELHPESNSAVYVFSSVTHVFINPDSQKLDDQIFISQPQTPDSAGLFNMATSRQLAYAQDPHSELIIVAMTADLIPPYPNYTLPPDHLALSQLPDSRQTYHQLGFAIIDDYPEIYPSQGQPNRGLFDLPIENSDGTYSLNLSNLPNASGTGLFTPQGVLAFQIASINSHGTNVIGLPASLPDLITQARSQLTP